VRECDIIMHNRRLISTHCGRKGYLAKFYYDRLNYSNFANKFVWVRKGANPHGPNKVWVPKATPILFDVVVGSHMMWDMLVPWGECVPRYMVTLLDASLSRGVWWEDHHGLEL